MAVSPLSEIDFCHVDEHGQQWEQGYQYCRIATSNSPVIKANYHLKIDFLVKPKMGIKSMTRSIVLPIRVMEPPRSQRVKMPDLTKEQHLNAKILANLLVYPKTADFPPQVKPISLPGGHYRLERVKRAKKPTKVAQQDLLVMDYLPAVEEEIPVDIVSIAQSTLVNTRVTRASLKTN